MDYLGKSDRQLITEVHEMMIIIKESLKEMKERDIKMNLKLSNLSSRKGKVEAKENDSTTTEN